MGRILLEFVLPALLPALLYALWLAAERRRSEAASGGGGDAKSRWAEAPWLWLLALGLFFAGFLTLAIALFGGSGIEGVYVPPRVLDDGRIAPGHIESP